MITLLKPMTKLEIDNSNDYELFLAICSDGLYIFNSDKTKIIETIVFGNCDYAFLCSTPDEDSFLDAITIIKKILLNGNNPLKVLNFQ
jgi:hypothetical protein